jgi:hypothetical protein
MIEASRTMKGPWRRLSLYFLTRIFGQLLLFLLW